MKQALISVLLTMILAILSCQEDWKFSTDSRYVLGFSVDTLRMDTVFTGVASATTGFMIYNMNDAGIRFDAVMGGGTASPFRMNLDGEGGAVITGLEIPSKDSLFCFISVNIPSADNTELFNAFDSIRFVLESGVVQCVRLSAQGQNAVTMRGTRVEDDMTLTSRLPYLIYDSLYVADGVTLTIKPGARLYFHSGAFLDVAGRLVAEGTADSMILMRGDRLDDMLTDLPYDLLAGQWGGIRIHGGSYGNIIKWCDIHGGEWGVKADSAGTAQVKMEITSSIIHNVNGNGIEATGCRIEVANSQITNAGGSCVDLAGGRSEFNFCTIASFSLWEAGKQAVILSDRREKKAAPIENAVFNNCIITGRHASEFNVHVADSVRNTVSYLVSNSLLSVQDSTDVRYSNVKFDNRGSETYGASNFQYRTMRGYSSVFALDSLSRARGIADTQSALWPVDLAGVPRPPSGADAGCYQYVPSK